MSGEFEAPLLKDKLRWRVSIQSQQTGMLTLIIINLCEQKKKTQQSRANVKSIYSCKS